MSAPCSQHVHPCLFLGKAVPISASSLQKEAAASSYTFFFPSSTGICTVCTTLTWNGQGSLTHCYQQHLDFCMSYGLWSAMVGRIQPNYKWFLELSVLELLTTLKGPDLIHNMLISPTEHTTVHEHKLTKELQPYTYLLYLIPRKNFHFVYLRMISSLYSSLWKIDLVPFCCMQKA